MILTHSNLIPAEEINNRKNPALRDCHTEFDVKTALQKLGHEYIFVGIDDDITPIRQAIREWKPDIAYNMMEAFAFDGALDFYIVSYLNMIGMPYTGCNPRGMVLARDKSLSKKLLTYHRIRVPEFYVFPRHKKINLNKIQNLPYPLIVKSTTEQGSIGIAQASYVTSPEDLVSRVEKLFNIAEGDAIAEQYIAGRELYVTVLGNKRLEVFPMRELVFDNNDTTPHIATYHVKWNEQYRKKHGMHYCFAENLPAAMEDKISKLGKRIYRILDLSGYARIDLRLTEDGKLYVLEANPNAAIACDDDVAFSADRAGIKYSDLIQRIINLGLRYHHKK